MWVWNVEREGERGQQGYSFGYMISRSFHEKDASLGDNLTMAVIVIKGRGRQGFRIGPGPANFKFKLKMLRFPREGNT